MKSKSLHKVSALLDALERTKGEIGNLSNMVQHIAQIAQKNFSADNCVIFAINPITNRFITSFSTTDERLEEQVPFEQQIPEEITQLVLRKGFLVVEDLEATPEHHSRFTRKEGFRSFVGLALRMKYNQKPLGVLFLNFRTPLRFTFDDQELFQLYADQASYILQETWLLARYREVARIGQEINHELVTADILFEKLQKHASDILDTSCSFLLAVHQPQTNTLDVYREEDGHSILHSSTPLKGISHYVIERQQSLFIQQMSVEVKHLPYQQDEVITDTISSKESLIFVPLVLRGISLGVLSIQHQQPNAYNQEDLFILELLANHIALAIYNMRLHDNLIRLNEAGQLLTQQLDSEQLLQAAVNKVQDATKADIIVLYPYEPTLQRFLLPPHIAGFLNSSSPLSMSPSQLDDVAALTLHHYDAVFAKESSTLYTTLNCNVHTRQRSFQQREDIRSTAAMPLRVGGEPVGVLFVNFRQPQHFDAPQKLLIEGLAHYIAIAIKNAQTFDTLIQRRIRELEILQNIDLELNRSLDLKSVLSTLLKLAIEHVPAEEASILLLASRTQTLETVVAIGHHAEARRRQIFSKHETKGITLWVLEHKQPARVDNVRHHLPWKDLYLSVADDMLSELDIPMLDGEEVIGVLNFESIRESAFNQEDVDFLLTLAGQAVRAIKNAQAYEREKRLAEETQVLNEISKEITRHLDLDHVFNQILEKALDLTHSMQGNLMLYDPGKNDLWMAAEHNITEEKKGLRQSMDQGVIGYVATHKHLLNVDPSQSPWNENNTRLFPGAHSELAIPMLAGNDLLGVLNVESSSPESFSKSDERLLQGLADLAVIALQNAQNFENEKRSLLESQVLNEISREIATQLDPIYIFQLILKKALEATKSTIGSLHLYDADLLTLPIAAEYGISEEKKSQSQGLGEGIVGYAAVQQRLSNVADISQPPWSTMYIEFSPGVCSELAVPMLEGNTLRGVLNIESQDVDHFDERDERLLKGLADLAVVALQSIERYKKARREAQQTEMLYRAGRELAKITNWEELEHAYGAILHIAEEHSPCQVAIRRYDDYTRELVLIGASHYQQTPPFPRIRLDEGLNGQVARERCMIVVPDTHHPLPGIALNLSDPTMRSLIITPIQFKDRYYGNLALAHRDAGYFRTSEAGFFEGLADQLASTIYRLEIARTRQELERISSIGHSAFELTHRLANDLGLVQFYTSDIQWRIGKLGIVDEFLNEKLEEIVQSVQGALLFSDKLKGELAQPVEEEAIMISAQELFKEVMVQLPLPAGISMSLECADGVGSVLVIRNQILDILRNLISNAIDAMPTGGKISLRVYNSGHFVALAVTDTGIGIPVNQQSKIFDLSFSTKDSSGFGLWSALRNALHNQGNLRVESQPGHTTFTLLLPRTDGGTV